jgi:hypothetical protein
LIRKYRLAIKGEEETRYAYRALSDSVNAEWMAEWTIAEEEALRLRGDLLMIYTVENSPGMQCWSSPMFLYHKCFLVQPHHKQKSGLSW